MDPARERALARNLALVRDRIAAAEARAARPAGSVRLVAVTKTVGPDLALSLVRLGQRELGENRVQDLLEKMEAIAGARFHMIGHLQRNKAKAFLRSGAFLHALDSERLARALEDLLEKGEAPARPRPLPCYVEVNVSGEASKGGLVPGEVPDFLARRRARGLLRPEGLMTIAPQAQAGERARPHFAALRALRDDLARAYPELCDLSMGMTQDFEAAIAEGATVVRIGSALFGGLF